MMIDSYKSSARKEVEVRGRAEAKRLLFTILAKWDARVGQCCCGGLTGKEEG